LGKDLPGFRVGVILVKMEEPLANGKGMGPPNDEMFLLVASHMVEQMRPADPVAVVGPGEIGILVSATSPVALQMVTQRVRHAVDARLEQIGEGKASKVMIQIGLGYFDQVNSEPESILARAREAARVIRIDGHRVAA
jgi:GGDEF domain-containing protein